jgi:phosphate transport system protein
MASELRIRFHRQLAEIDRSVGRLFELVYEGIVAASGRLLSADGGAGPDAASGDAVVDRLQAAVEELTECQLLTQSPMVGDMRYLVTVLRVVPELERSGDLAEHVARRADSLATGLTPPVRTVLADMADCCRDMWHAVGQAWAERDELAAARLDTRDNELDRLHRELTAALLDAGLPRGDLIQLTLIARFYERLGDHAVHIAERISYLAGDGRAGSRRSDAATREGAVAVRPESA